MIERTWELLGAGVAETAAGIVLLVIGVLYVLCAVRLSLVDLREHRLPNRIVYPWTLTALVLFAVVAVLTSDLVSLLEGVIGGLLWAFGFLAVRLIHSPALGMGDVKLAVVLGLHAAFIGWSTLVLAVAATFVIGGLVALGLLLTGKAGRGSRIPFGPFMLGGTALALLLG